MRNSPPPFRQVRLSLVNFSVSLLFTFLLWNHYFNSAEQIDRNVAANLILIMGFLFAVSAGLFGWALENRQNYLEQALDTKEKALSEKNRENKSSEVACAAIYQACRILFSEKDIESPNEKVIDLMIKVLKADEGSLMLIDTAGNFSIAASRGIPEEVSKQVHLKLGERVAGRAAREKREFLIVDGLDHYPEFRGVESNPRIRSSMICPLVSQGEVLGVLNLNRVFTQENFTVADLMNASIFAAQLAQAMRNRNISKKLGEKLAELENFQAQILELLKARNS